MTFDNCWCDLGTLLSFFGCFITWVTVLLGGGLILWTRLVHSVSCGGCRVWSVFILTICVISFEGKMVGLFCIRNLTLLSLLMIFMRMCPLWIVFSSKGCFRVDCYKNDSDFRHLKVFMCWISFECHPVWW